MQQTGNYFHPGDLLYAALLYSAPPGLRNIRAKNMLNTHAPVKQSISTWKICKPDVNVTLLILITLVLLQNQALCDSFDLNKEKNSVTSEPKMKVGNPRPRPTRNCQSDNSQRKRRFWQSRGIQSISPWLSHITVARLWTCLQRPYREADVKRSESTTQLWAVVLPEEATFRHWPWMDRRRVLRLRRHLKFPDCGKMPAPLYLRKDYWIWRIKRGECRRAVVVGTASVFTVVVVAKHYSPFLYKHALHLPRQQKSWWKVIIKILGLKSFGKFKTSITPTTDHPMYNLSTPTHRMVPETGRVSLLCLWPLRTAAGSSGWLPDYSKANYSQRHPDHLHLLLWCEPARQRQNMREKLNNGVPDIS